jgi:hypothetical protein
MARAESAMLSNGSRRLIKIFSHDQWAIQAPGDGSEVLNTEAASSPSGRFPLTTKPGADVDEVSPALLAAVPRVFGLTLPPT